MKTFNRGLNTKFKNVVSWLSSSWGLLGIRGILDSDHLKLLNLC